jgi:hypothetical protein
VEEARRAINALADHLKLVEDKEKKAPGLAPAH